MNIGRPWSHCRFPLARAPRRSSGPSGAFLCGSAGKPSIRRLIQTVRQRRSKPCRLSAMGRLRSYPIRVSRRKGPNRRPATMKALVDAMQNAWRFVEDPALRERLKEAKGIGTPATRAEIIKGLRRQNLLAADGKLVLPPPAGLQLFQLLRGAAQA